MFQAGLILTLLSAPGGWPLAQDSATSALAQIRGTWILVEQSMGGLDLETDHPGEFRLIVSDTRFTFLYADGTIQPAWYSCPSPGVIDLEMVLGDLDFCDGEIVAVERLENIPGIYRLEGDTLTLRLDIMAGNRRPPCFDSFLTRLLFPMQKGRFIQQVYRREFP